MSNKVNPFAPNAVQLSPEAQALSGRYSRQQIQELILANVSVREGGVMLPVTLSLDTSAYATGDVLADTQEVAGALRGVGGSARLTGLVVVDQDDNTAAAMDVVLLRSNVSLGTENAAPSISDANALEILGIVNVPSGNFVDVGGAKIATVANIGIQVSSPFGTSVFVAVITRGTPTQTASGIKLNLSFRQD